MTANHYVIDTSILMSAAISGQSKPRQVLDHIASRGRLLFCEQTMFEITSRFYREKFDRWLTSNERKQFLEILVKATRWVSITGTLRACRDPNDDMFLETALLGQADAIITGDKDLLVLHPFKDIPILTAADFLEQFER